MDLDQFFERLPKTGWALIGGKIRCNSGRDCPIESLDDSRYAFYSDAAKRLGMSDELRDKIATTADGYVNEKNYDPALRARLLQHCGLTGATHDG